MTDTCVLAPWNDASSVQACTLLRVAQVVAVPTETVYGLAGLAWDDRAVSRIFAAKERPSFDPLIAHVPPSWHSLERLEAAGVIRLAGTSAAWRQVTSALMQAFWPGPLTLLMPRHERISELACSGLPDVAVRMPAHPIFQQLLEELQSPLAAPSANRFGRVSPTRAQDVWDELHAAIPLIIDGGQATVGVESTILHVDAEGRALCLRLGACPREALAKVLGYEPPLVSKQHPTLAPGMLERHYAPEKRLWLLEPGAPLPAVRREPGQTLGVLLCDSYQPDWLKDLGEPLQLVRLAPDDDDQTAARALFPALRALDASAASLILALAPKADTGLWPAIRDRLQRASS